MALTKCTEAASSGQPLPSAAGQGGREQSFDPTFHTACPPLVSFEWPCGRWCDSEQTQALVELPKSCPGSLCSAATSCCSSLGAEAGDTTGTASPGAALLRQGFPSRVGESPVQGLDTVSFASPVTLEMASRVCVSIPAWWLWWL